MKEISNGKNITLDSGHQPRFGYGTYAARWANPSVGDTYYATDTMASFLCLITGTWSLMSSIGSTETYENHSGVLDNFMQNFLSGNATAITNAPNHLMTLSSGLNIQGIASWYSKKTFVLGSKPIILNYIIQNNVMGAPIAGSSWYGLCDSFSNTAQLNSVIFIWNGTGWDLMVSSAGISTIVTGVTVAVGDLLTIVATSTACEFFVNGIRISKITSNIPSVAMYFGSTVFANTTVTAQSTEVDMVGLSVYK